MNANELRIGNYVLLNGNVVTMDYHKIRIQVFADHNHKNSEGEGFKGYEPIPLTKDVLKKTPFEFSHLEGTRSIYALGRLCLEILPDNEAAIYFDGNLFCYIHSNLHSLQNFYFATMREELTINI